jgi:hypothetical protein
MAPQEDSRTRQETYISAIHWRPHISPHVSTFQTMPRKLVLTIFSGCGCIISATILEECHTQYVDSYYDLQRAMYSYYNWQLAINTFISLSAWLLLYVFIFTLNTMLREQLGPTSVVYKRVLFNIVGIVGAATCAEIGLSGYTIWFLTDAGWHIPLGYGHTLTRVFWSYRLAYYSLYIASLLVSGGLALISIIFLPSRRSPAGVSHTL